LPWIAITKMSRLFRHHGKQPMSEKSRVLIGLGEPGRLHYSKIVQSRAKRTIIIPVATNEACFLFCHQKRNLALIAPPQLHHGYLKLGDEEQLLF